MIPFHRIYFDIQNPMNSIYSESRKKSRIAQMLLVSYRSRNKEFSLETAAQCHTVVHELCQRTKCSLCSLFIQLYARGIECCRSVFHIVCMTYPCASNICYTVCGYALNSHFPPFYFRSVPITQNNHLSTKSQKFGVR